VTEQITRLLSKNELRAVLGHEISHLKNRDVAVITALSVIPIIMWYIAWSTMFSHGRDRGNQVAIGIAAFILYFVTNLLVLYGSRIREYYADQGSIELGNAPHYLASALYKLVYGSAKTPHDSLKQMEGYKAFFLNDPSRAMNEFNELKQIDDRRRPERNNRQGRAQCGEINGCQGGNFRQADGASKHSPKHVEEDKAPLKILLKKLLLWFFH
jgi:heat shock protein HtpX